MNRILFRHTNDKNSAEPLRGLCIPVVSVKQICHTRIGYPSLAMPVSLWSISTRPAFAFFLHFNSKIFVLSSHYGSHFTSPNHQGSLFMRRNEVHCYRLSGKGVCMLLYWLFKRSRRSISDSILSTPINIHPLTTPPRWQNSRWTRLVFILAKICAELGLCKRLPAEKRNIKSSAANADVPSGLSLWAMQEKKSSFAHRC